MPMTGLLFSFGSHLPRRTYWIVYTTAASADQAGTSTYRDAMTIRHIAF
jgi:hypothetical protein